MSEISLPLLGTLRLRSIPGAARRLLGKKLGLRKGDPAPEVVLQAASAISNYAREHAALFEREERLRARAERLAGEGTPSESANNRAERARREVEAGLLAVRERFAPSAGERRHAFDREVGRLYPGLGVESR